MRKYTFKYSYVEIPGHIHLFTCEGLTDRLALWEFAEHLRIPFDSEQKVSFSTEALETRIEKSGVDFSYTTEEISPSSETESGPKFRLKCSTSPGVFGSLILQTQDSPTDKWRDAKVEDLTADLMARILG